MAAAAEQAKRAQAAATEWLRWDKVSLRAGRSKKLAGRLRGKPAARICSSRGAAAVSSSAGSFVLVHPAPHFPGSPEHYTEALLRAATGETSSDNCRWD